MKDPHTLAMEQFAETSTWLERTGGYAHSMTLRDHFAGLAMQALIPIWYANFRAGDLGDGIEDWDNFYASFAAEAHLMADDMIKERAK
jgi:hypothetical protein